MIKNILRKSKISRRHFNYLLNGDRNASVTTAKRLERATGIPREIWTFGTSSKRKEALKKYLAKQTDEVANAFHLESESVDS
jgi:transcriptional regulator with XRE-family HTH domain